MGFSKETKCLQKKLNVCQSCKNVALTRLARSQRSDVTQKLVAVGKALTQIVGWTVLTRVSVRVTRWGEKSPNG
jgi:hypothetical protein